MDYRREDRKIAGKLSQLRSHLIALDSLCQKPPIITLQKNKPPFSQDMHFKIKLSSRVSKLLNSKPGCEVSALHFSEN
jgi:hypothetical protein